MAEEVMVQKVAVLREALTRYYDEVSAVFSTDEVIFDLMRLRNYTSEAMYNTLKEMGVFRVNSMSDINLFVQGYSMKQLSDFGLLNAEGEFLLAGRYVLPIRDITGQVTALVGWSEYGGPKKYVTTPTFGFSRDATFFNYDSFRLAHEKFGGVTFLVEGIFDSVALKSLGFPVLGAQGLELSSIKRRMLRRYTKVIAMHDDDKAGMGVSPYLNKLSSKPASLIWDIETEHTFVRILDKTDTVDESKVKDSDDLIKYYDAYDDLVKAMSAKKLYNIVLED